MQRKILVVDDQPILRETLKNFLSRQNYSVLLAGNAEEALKILSKAKVDVMLVDQVMPGMSGTELLAIVREDYPETIRIILTGHATLNDAIDAINKGEVHRFFTKPCKIEELVQTIEELIRLQQGKKADRLMQSMEKQHPGITKIKQDSDGRIIIEDD